MAALRMPGHKPQKRLWLRCFHWSWRSTLVAMALVAMTLVYLNEVGIPDFAKRSLVARLQEQGLAVEFSRLRWRVDQGIVADALQIKRGSDRQGEEIYVEQAQLRLAWEDLWNFQAPSVRALLLQGGRLDIPLAGITNEPPTHFAIDRVHARLVLTGSNSWNLEDLTARWRMGEFHAAGSLTNVDGVLGRRRSTQNDAWKADLRRFQNTLVRLRSDTPGRMDLRFNLDLLNPERSQADLSFAAGGVHSPWGEFGSIQLEIDLNRRPPTNRVLDLGLRLVATQAATPFAGAEFLRFEGELEQPATNVLPAQASWRMSALRPSSQYLQASGFRASGRTALTDGGLYATEVHTELLSPVTSWGQLKSLTLDLHARHWLNGPPTNWIPDTWDLDLAAGGIRSRWATGATLGVHATGERTATAKPLPAFWKWLAPWNSRVSLSLTNAVSDQIILPEFTADLAWTNGRVQVNSLRSQVFNGRFDGSGSLDVQSRDAVFKVDTTFDLHRLAPIIGPSGSAWLDQFGWQPEDPLRVSGQASARLPEWGRRNVDWNAEVVPTLIVNGLAVGTNVNYRGAPALTAYLPFAHSNSVWRVQGAHFVRPEGTMDLDFTEWTLARDYLFRIRADVDPQPVGPILGKGAVKLLADFKFSEPPEVECEYGGRWHEPDRTYVRGFAKIRNVEFRGQRVDSCDAHVDYADRRLHAGPVSLRQGTNTFTADSVDYDIPTEMVYFTNAVSTLDPTGVMQAIGPKTARTFEAFEFGTPPRVVLNGGIATRDSHSGTRIRFDAAVPTFRWWKLAASGITTSLTWTDNSIVLTNIVGGFHGGRISGNLSADFEDPEDSVFRFDAVVADAQLGSLLRDISPTTNRIEGTLGGRLTVNSAHSRTNGPWEGIGAAKLENGFLWNLPLFGALSKLLENVMPGIVLARFNSGTTSFTITNRTMKTQDLVFRSPSLRLKIDGTVDFDGRLDGRLEASPLRDLPIVGRIVSLALAPVSKLFEYDVKGTLGQPKMGLRYIPNFLLAPFHPIQTLRDILPPEKQKTDSSTNSVPERPPSN